MLAGCASTKQYVPLPNQNVKTENPNKARIYVMRPQIIGAAVGMKVLDGNKPIGKTGAKGFLCWERDPGNVQVTGKAENKKTISFKAEKGEVYYVKQSVTMGIIMARNKLQLLTPDAGKSILSECKPPKVQ